MGCKMADRENKSAFCSFVNGFPVQAGLRVRITYGQCHDSKQILYSLPSHLNDADGFLVQSSKGPDLCASYYSRN